MSTKKGKTVLLLLPEPTGLYLLMTYSMQNLPSNRHPSSSCSWKLQSRVSLMQPKWQKKDGITVILNPAPAPTQQLPDELLANVDILIPNVTEAESISGMHLQMMNRQKKRFCYISSKGIKTVIITMGAKGALCL